MKCTVCVATVRPDTLPHTIQSIMRQTYPDWELILVGQGHDPELERVGKWAEALDSRVRYVHIEQRGVSRARNAALRIASGESGEIVAMIDDDCEAAPDWLEALESLFAQHPQVGMIGGALIAPPVSRWKLESCLANTPTELYYDPASGEIPPPAWRWIGANVAMRKTVVDQVGAFDEYLGAGPPDFPAAEDIDYFMRIIAAGIAVLSSPVPKVFHTYGTRRGIRQNIHTARDYARGNGGLDGKLTLAGNPHGERSASRMLPQGLAEVARSGKLHRLPLVVFYAVNHRAAYRYCLREFALGQDGNLCRVGSQQTISTHHRSLAVDERTR